MLKFIVLYDKIVSEKIIKIVSLPGILNSTVLITNTTH